MLDFIQGIRTHQDGLRFAEQQISDGFAAIRTALEKNDSMAICGASRDFALELPGYAGPYPEAWPEERVKEATQLLRLCAEKTQGTDVESNCADREEMFTQSIDTAQRAGYLTLSQDELPVRLGTI